MRIFLACSNSCKFLGHILKCERNLMFPCATSPPLRQQVRYLNRTETWFSFTENDFVVCGKPYKKDEWTNVTPYLVPRIKQNLLIKKNHPLALLSEATKRFFDDYKFFEFNDPVVSPHDNFDSLLIPKNHVSRGTSDTYYLDKNHILRTHTSVHQTHCLSAGHDKFLCIADVYRRDAIDKTHYPCFHQCEAFDSFTADQLSLSNIYKNKDQEKIRTPKSQENYSDEATAKVEQHLKKTIENYVRFLLGKDFEFKWVDAYFPFTHPSWELEIFFNGNWLEVVGCGIVEEKILLDHNVSNKISWALGFGLERIAMVRYAIPDVRLFWTDDTNFFHQFTGIGPMDQYTFKEIPPFNPCINDMSFWLPQNSENWSPNDFYDLCRSEAGDLCEYVELIDDYVHPKTNRRSQCYRIFYRSCQSPLTKAFVNTIHDKIAQQVEKQYNVEVRNKLPLK
ncbi:phenylalanyl-tRNA synthetase, mitochondrial [Brevipalpus obovatus]|uniref:phenylalanyl-tRNA synthetase, mitochondrial n=1 Tax=Brevipalpus obovatus TaxID=246614 RepID=UPI003D9F991B